ncbi:hypothetical protein KCU77_g7236, partial [Aureobasidium melanogenum]
MLAHEIKPNWTGASRDELLTKPDVLPPQYSSGHTVISPSMRYASYPMAQAMPSTWIPQSMARPIAPLPINRVPNTRYAGHSSGQGMSQAHMPRPLVHPRPTMLPTAALATNMHFVGSNDSSDIDNSRSAKRSRTETTVKTTRTED